MTGVVEAIGLTLGVLPLIISAVEHYEDVLKPFKRYSKFAPELKIYQYRLETQKTIFRNECVLLLTDLTGRPTAKTMLNEALSPAWCNLELHARLQSQLGESAITCKVVIDTIKNSLHEVETEVQQYVDTLQGSTPPVSLGDRFRRSRISMKAKFSLNESRLEECLKALQRLNQEFGTLVKQTVKLNDNFGLHGKSTTYSYMHDHELKRCLKIQKASAQLFKALEKACGIHEQHSAFFRLEAPMDSSENRAAAVRFCMAFTSYSSSTSRSSEPIWIGVDSMAAAVDEDPPNDVLGETEVNVAFKTLSENLKNDLKPSKRGAGTRSVRFAQTTVHSSSNLITALHPDPSLPDFCKQHDFCNHVQQYTTPILDNKHLGYFEKDTPYKNLVYFIRPVADTGHPFSLEGIINSISQGSHTFQLLQYEIIQLARQLASAVLQFGHTPLLKQSWHSSDVVFFGQNLPSTHLKFPHLDVKVGEHRSAMNIESISQTTASSSTSPPFIRNPYLFGLGVMMIELAYKKPITSLQEPQDTISGLGDNYTTFFTANRISKSMDSSLGIPYARIVRKCLGCDFGEDTDFENPKLQAVFFRDIVCELARLEKGFERLQLGT